jgi:hypothetical protein
LVKQEIKVWVDYHKWWFTQAKSARVPLYFVRYEDILVGTEKSLNEIFAFALELESTEGTVIEKRISDILQSNGHNASIVYKP